MDHDLHIVIVPRKSDDLGSDSKELDTWTLGLYPIAILHMKGHPIYPLVD